MTSRFYRTDPTDPEAPVVLDEYRGIRPGDRVIYTGSMQLDEELVVDELVRLDADFVTAVLGGGTWEVSADNLRRAEA